MLTSSGRISILIVDSHPIFRDGLRSRLEQQSEFYVIGEVDNGRTAISSCRTHTPDVVLIDPFMQGLNGFQSISKLKSASPDIKILVASDIDDIVDVQIALSEGASGYILKSSHSDEFLNAIRAISNNGSYLPMTLMNGLIEATKKTKSTGNMFGLTMRELDILRELAIGCSNKDIARNLKISVRTVETHRQNIRQKTGTFATTDLVRIANRLGLTQQNLAKETV
ncbi:MAG: response regulator [Methyloligellaceae bacterium]